MKTVVYSLVTCVIVMVSISRFMRDLYRKEDGVVHHQPRRAGVARSLLSDTTREVDQRSYYPTYIRDDDPIYDGGLYDEYEYDGFPTIPPEDDVVIANVLSGSVTSLQELCPRQVVFTLSEHCTCSTSSDNCLKLKNKAMVQELSPFAPPGTVITPYGDGQGCSPPDQLVGCACEWENICPYVVFAELYMDILCVPCDGISPGRDTNTTGVVGIPPAPEPSSDMPP